MIIVVSVSGLLPPLLNSSPPAMVISIMERKSSTTTIPSRNSVSGLLILCSSIRDWPVMAAEPMAITPARKTVSTIGQPKARPIIMPMKKSSPVLTRARMKAEDFVFLSLVTLNSSPTKNMRSVRPSVER